MVLSPFVQGAQGIDVQFWRQESSSTGKKRSKLHSRAKQLGLARRPVSKKLRHTERRQQREKKKSNEHVKKMALPPAFAGPVAAIGDR